MPGILPPGSARRTGGSGGESRPRVVIRAALVMNAPVQAALSRKDRPGLREIAATLGRDSAAHQPRDCATCELGICKHVAKADHRVRQQVST
jgi:hypothetical protein